MAQGQILQKKLVRRDQIDHFNVQTAFKTLHYLLWFWVTHQQGVTAN